MRKNRTLAVLAGTIVLSLTATTGAVAGSLIGSKDIKDDSVRSVDIHDGTVKKRDIKPKLVQAFLADQAGAGTQGPAGADGKDGKDGAAGPAGPAGKDALFGAVYRTAHYDNGGGGIATVTCPGSVSDPMRYVAVGGGAYSNAGNGNTASQPITSSFAGRMDWDGADDINGTADDNLPRPGRLDGWVVMFGNGDAPTADKGTLEIYAMCVPVSNLTTEVNHY